MEGLKRFIKAQERDYAAALAEIRSGFKTSHWIWYVFPQLRGLGMSSMSEFYGIAGLEEAKAYLAHPVLGARLREISTALLAHAGQAAWAILGEIDAMKVRSSMTLFDAVEPDSVFSQVLDAFYGGAARRSDARDDRRGGVKAERKRWRR